MMVRPLHWIAFAPTGPGRHPAVVVLPGGGFITARPDTGIDVTARDLAALGFIAFVVEYRLAPPGHIAGQKSDGRFPDQHNDVHLAIRAARSFVPKKIPPLFLIASEDEAIPPGQIKTMVALLRATGVTNFQQLVLPGVRLSYPYWPNVQDPTIAFLKGRGQSRRR
jgi:hypothetical protein